MEVQYTKQLRKTVGEGHSQMMQHVVLLRQCLFPRGRSVWARRESAAIISSRFALLKKLRIKGPHRLLTELHKFYLLGRHQMRHHCCHPHICSSQLSFSVLCQCHYFQRWLKQAVFRRMKLLYYVIRLNATSKDAWGFHFFVSWRWQELCLRSVHVSTHNQCSLIFVETSSFLQNSPILYIISSSSTNWSI